MELKELAMHLCSLMGPSGFESPVCAWISDYIAPFADEVQTDVLGNLYALKRCGKPGAKKIMLDAHMDEIGFIVTGAENGFLTFSPVGGVDARMLPARELQILSDPPVFGVVDVIPPHLLKGGEEEKALEFDKLYIDVGLSQEEAEKLIPPGTPAVYAGGCQQLGENQLCGKALDDRACTAIVLKAFEELSSENLSVDICCVISTQEEVGLRGAVVSAWSAAPDVAVVIDVTHAKTPDGPEVKTAIGKGAAIGIGPNMTRSMVKDLFRLAEETEILCQADICPGGDSGTNAAAVQVSRMGVATALLSLPIKYMHTPLETASLTDMDCVRRLLVEYIRRMEG